MKDANSLVIRIETEELTYSVSNLITFILNNPLLELNRMILDFEATLSDYQFYNLTDLAKLIKRDQFSFLVESNKDGYENERISTELIVKYNPKGLLISYILRYPGMTQINELKRIVSLFKQIISLSGDCIKVASINSADLVLLYRDLKIKKIYPIHKSYVHWIHVIRRDSFEFAYGNIYAHQDLLNCPAFHVEEWENDVVFIQSYEDPFSFDTEETQQQIIKLNNYWLEKAKLPDITGK